ncbi:MAG: S-methyl-5-thioribose-1-phosphate isomerase, partial [Gemmatimonadetes bacterium]|nr:S-methyl-5-thioribose-1-phosphate isomerase [Gemmatimonadota bacterium]
FYVCLPSPTIDWTLKNGVKEVPIEERDGAEVSKVTGRTADGAIATVQVIPDGSPVVNYGFDVTPARLVTGLVTERGVASASKEGLLGLFPERR